MTVISSDEQLSGPPRLVGRPEVDQGPPDVPEPDDWVRALSVEGPEQDSAMRQLHGLMVRAAAHQVWRMRSALADPSPGAVDVIANQAADEAMSALLGKLDTFEGRSRFTTWAYKFAILQAATEVRRVQWRHREVDLSDIDDVPTGGHDSPEHHAEASELASAITAAMHTALTPYQRRIAVALLVDGVPIDVLADRLATTRGALYKTLYDTRTRLRAELARKGHLVPGPGGAGATDRDRTSSTTPQAGIS